jgi:hypothetical protein
VSKSFALCFSLFVVMLEFFASHHDGDGRFGDEVVGEGTEENTFKGRATAGTEDNKRGFDIVNLEKKRKRLVSFVGLVYTDLTDLVHYWSRPLTTSVNKCFGLLQ